MVRLTEPSTLRSAKSLMAQPAARIKIAPKAKISNTDQEGNTPGKAVMAASDNALGAPKAAKNTAHNVGHNNNSMPTGLSKRVR